MEIFLGAVTLADLPPNLLCFKSLKNMCRFWKQGFGVFYDTINFQLSVSSTAEWKRDTLSAINQS